MAQEIPLDGDLIKVLASDTRREILGLLKDRRRTVTELADDLDLQKATVHEHLKKLVDSELVQREEDDRLWVYYQLTPRGKRILNPSRSRIYLVVGLGVLAAIVGAIVLAIFLMQSPTSAPAGAAPEDRVQVALADDQTFGQEGVRLEGVVNTSERGQLEAYLVTEEEAARLQEGETPRGIPLSTRTEDSDRMTSVDAEADGTAKSGDTTAPTRDAVTSGPVQTTFTTDSSVPPGTYLLYLRSGSDADNRGDLPRVRVVSLEAEVSEPTWWRGVSDPLEVTVRQDGTPASGQIRLVPTDDLGPGVDAQVERGQARFPADQLDDLDPGTYALRFSPETSERSTRLDEVRIHDPSIAVTPRHAIAGTATTLTVSVHGGLEALDAPVLVDGARLLDRSTEPGRTQLELAPDDPGTVTVEVGRIAERTVELVPGMRASITVEDGPQWRLELARPNGTAASDVAVRLDGSGLGFTNASGTLVIDDLPQGLHRLAFQTAEGTTVQRFVEVDGWQVRPVDPRVSISPRQTMAPEGQVQVDVDLNVSGPGQVLGTLTSHVNGDPVDAAEIDRSEGNDSVRVTTTLEDERELRFGARIDRVETAPVDFANETTAPDDDTSDDGGGGGGAAGDGASDAQDTEGLDDSDGDGVEDGSDNCPVTPNVGQTDSDGDGTGDACDDDPLIELDVGPIDGDGILAFRDNCPETANPDQLDTDGDGAGDACEPPADRPDADADGIVDADDACPQEPGPAASSGCPALEGGDAADGMAEAEGAQETPVVGLAAVLAAVLLVALVAGRRRRR